MNGEYCRNVPATAGAFPCCLVLWKGIDLAECVFSAPPVAEVVVGAVSEVTGFRW